MRCLALSPAEVEVDDPTEPVERREGPLVTLKALEEEANPPAGLTTMRSSEGSSSTSKRGCCCCCCLGMRGMPWSSCLLEWKKGSCC